MRDDLPHAMRETARRLEPDVVRLTAGGVSRGTRRRRIERAVQILGSAVAVAVVFAGVTLVGTHRGTGTGIGAGTETGGAERTTNQPAVSDGGSAPTSGPTATTPTAPTTPTEPKTPTAPKTPTTGTPQITREELVANLKSCLGGTGVAGSSFLAVGTDSPPATTTVVKGTILVDAQLSTAKNVGFLSIVFSGPRSHVPEPGRPSLRTDGSVVYVSREEGSSDGRQADRDDLQVTLVRPDGSSLSASETNAANSKSAAAYAGAPLLLSVDQLVTVLDSPSWDDALAAADALPPTDAALAPPSSTLSSTPFFTSSPSSSSAS